jgi:hypothetical protein
MRAAGALLGNLGFIIPVDGSVWTAIHYILTTRSLHRIDDDQAIIPLVHGTI